VTRTRDRDFFVAHLRSDYDRRRKNGTYPSEWIRSGASASEGVVRSLLHRTRVIHTSLQECYGKYGAALVIGTAPRRECWPGRGPVRNKIAGGFMRTSWRRVRRVLPLALVSVMFSVGTGAQHQPGSRHAPKPDPFSLHPADDGAQQWEDMTPAERSDVTRMGAWADRNSAAIHDAFSAAVTRTTELRALQEAQSSSGLEGVETLGVVP